MIAQVLHVIQTLNPTHGGTTEAVHLLSRPLVGFEFGIACADPPNSPWGTTWGNRLWQAGPAHTPFGFAFRSRTLLREVIPSMSLVVIHGLWQHLGLIAASEARRARVPYMVFPHGMLDPWALSQSKLKKKFALITGYQSVLDRATAIGFTTQEEMDLAGPLLQNSKSSKVLIPLGVEEPPASNQELQSSFLKSNPSLAERSIVLFLGRLHPKKGCDLLIESFAKWRKSTSSRPLRDLRPHLRMAGPASSSAYLNHLLGLCKRHGLEIGKDVTFPGMIDATSKWHELASAKCLVLPSHQENFGLVVAEALACGLPVLLSDKVNTAHAVKSHNAGLVAPATLDGTISSLTKWSLLDHHESGALATNARTLYEKSFSASRARERFAGAIKALISPIHANNKFSS
jgi:glycosyltransferase involved in cell wall biosynthesis